MNSQTAKYASEALRDHRGCCCHPFINPACSSCHATSSLIKSRAPLACGPEIRASAVLWVGVIPDTMKGPAPRLPPAAPCRQSGRVTSCQACNGDVMTGPEPAGAEQQQFCGQTGRFTTVQLLTRTTCLGSKCLMLALLLRRHVLVGHLLPLSLPLSTGLCLVSFTPSRLLCSFGCCLRSCSHLCRSHRFQSC